MFDHWLRIPVIKEAGGKPKYEKSGEIFPVLK